MRLDWRRGSGSCWFVGESSFVIVICSCDEDDFYYKSSQYQLVCFIHNHMIILL